MRLGIFVFCVVSLILVSRFYSLSATKEVPENESVSPVAMAVYDEPLGERGSVEPVDSALQNDSTLKPPQAFLSPTQSDSDWVTKSKFDAKAKNVQFLVRAQYEVPKTVAEQLMKLDTDMLVELAELESEHPGVAILQVTTDEDTQKQFAGFLSALYPSESIEKLRDCCANRKSGRTCGFQCCKTANQK